MMIRCFRCSFEYVPSRFVRKFIKNEDDNSFYTGPGKIVKDGNCPVCEEPPLLEGDKNADPPLTG